MTPASEPLRPPSSRSLDRRALLRAGLAAVGGLAGAAAFGTAPAGASTASPAAASSAARAGVSTAAAVTDPVPASHAFDLTASSPELFRGRILDETHHAMQGIAFDQANQRLFIVQPRNGLTEDNLSINHVSLDGSTIYSTMHIANAGHGVSFGAEAVGSSTYIWIECDADTTGSAARGTAIARFKYVGNAAPANVTKHFVGSTAVSCAIDPVHNRLAVRRKVSGAWQFGVYELTGTDTVGTRLVQRTQPSLSVGGTEQTNQGWTLYGQYVYMLSGDGSTRSNTGAPDYPYINSRLWCFDLDNGDDASVVSEAARHGAPFLTQAGKSIYYREPEGMAVFQPSGGQVGLYFGFASRPTDGGLDRYASIFHKDGWE